MRLSLCFLALAASSVTSQAFSDSQCTSTPCPARSLPPHLTPEAASRVPPALTPDPLSPVWHERYHGLLSMAAYGDYETTCAKTFTQASLQKSFPNSTEAPFTVLTTWGPTAIGASGFAAIIPEMDKVVMVFTGLYGWEQLNMTAAPLDVFDIAACKVNSTTVCTAHQGALTAYLEAKAATNDWEAIKTTINQTGHQWSLTGHGFGGMVAQVASLDLGWRALAHWSHSHGAARVFNPDAANVYNSLFQGEAGQRTVANEDSVPTTIPESDSYTMTLEGFHIYGVNFTYGMNYDVCQTDATDPRCLGGSNKTDHWYYYTSVGECGSGSSRYNFANQTAFESSASAAFYATATSTYVPASTVARSSTVAVVPTTSQTPAIQPPRTSSTSSVAPAATGLSANSTSSATSLHPFLAPLVLIVVGALSYSFQ